MMMVWVLSFFADFINDYHFKEFGINVLWYKMIDARTLLDRTFCNL
jgi:hypothetical protein